MTDLDDIIILGDKRDRIMDAVAEVIAADTERAARTHIAAANAALEVCLPAISAFLEDYGADPGAGIMSGPCTEATHALAWVTTTAGFSFEIYRAVYSDRAENAACWLLHPETGVRVYRIDYQARWENAARAIHAADEATIEIGDEDKPDHPADVLVDALRAFVESIGSDHDRGF